MSKNCGNPNTFINAYILQKSSSNTNNIHKIPKFPEIPAERYTQIPVIIIIPHPKLLDNKRHKRKDKRNCYVASLLKSKFNSQVCDCMEISVGGAICKELALN